MRRHCHTSHGNNYYLSEQTSRLSCYGHGTTFLLYTALCVYTKSHIMQQFVERYFQKETRLILTVAVVPGRWKYLSKRLKLVSQSSVKLWTGAFSGKTRTYIYLSSAHGQVAGKFVSSSGLLQWDRRVCVSHFNRLKAANEFVSKCLFRCVAI